MRPALGLTVVAVVAAFFFSAPVQAQQAEDPCVRCAGDCCSQVGAALFETLVNSCAQLAADVVGGACDACLSGGGCNYARARVSTRAPRVRPELTPSRLAAALGAMAF